jgi:hypothetical protein
MNLDIETVTMMRVAGELDRQHIKYWPMIYRGIRERCAMFESGRTHAPQWFRKRLHELDPLLDIRWDFLKEQYLIERYSRSDRAYVNVMYVDQLDERVFVALHEADTWRFSTPQAYLRWKHEKGIKKRAQIEQAADDKMAEAIDSLSTKQADEFVAVEQAMAVGETVVLHGESERIMDRMREGSKKAMAQGIAPPKAKMYRSWKRKQKEGV